uniref:NAD(P)-binding domain-containing protein n=1 Tax=Strix occidentalis caurina TaxID=311401 RepID=A0A8D0FQA0_STROC
GGGGRSLSGAATGRAGLEGPYGADRARWSVTVLVRDRARLPPQPRPLRVLVGDARDPVAVGEAVRGQDAAIILLGTRDDLGTGGGTPPHSPEGPPHSPRGPWTPTLHRFGGTPLALGVIWGDAPGPGGHWTPTPHRYGGTPLALGVAGPRYPIDMGGPPWPWGSLDPDTP